LIMSNLVVRRNGTRIEWIRHGFLFIIKKSFV
jgi:hypothetical protein